MITQTGTLRTLAPAAAGAMLFAGVLMQAALHQATVPLHIGEARDTAPQTCRGKAVTVPGATDEADTVVGTPGDDVITGGGGGDHLVGLGGRDTICGDDGDDHLDGGPGDDDLNGLAGDDVLRASSGVDVLCGGPGRDTLDGRTARDRARGDSTARSRHAGAPPKPISLPSGSR